MRTFWKAVLLALLLLGMGVWYRQCVVIDGCYDGGGYRDRERERCVRATAGS